MSALISWFDSMPAWYTFAWLVLVLSLCSAIESVVPLLSNKKSRLKHLGTNSTLFFVNTLASIPFTASVTAIALWVQSNEFGLLHLANLPLWMELLMAIVVLDFMGQYLVHYLLHRVNWMWRLHMIHHSDTNVDATTAFRHHPGDIVLRTFFAAAAVVIMGIPLAYYALYQCIRVFFGAVTHANFRLPPMLDRTISYVFVTPDMHKFHHHDTAPWTDSNFGNLFSVWDRMFGTLVYDDVNAIRYGLDVTDDDRDLDIAYQLAMPFNSDISTAGRPGLSVRHSLS